MANDLETSHESRKRWTVPALAAAWSMSEAQLYRLIRTGKIAAFRVGRRKGIRITDEERARWENANRIEVETLPSDNEGPKPLQSTAMTKALAAA